MVTKSRDFDKLLMSSIDEALLSLGESSKQSIYLHIEKIFKISRNEVPENLQKFQESLERIFGIGARFIEILKMKNLYAKIGCPLIMEKNEQLEFVKYVDAARQSFLRECHDSDNC